MNQKILFVDDEPAALNCYRQMLQSEFDIATAVGGEDGLVSLRNHGPFAIVISDMQMAGMDGVQFLKRVRQVAPNTIRLLLTGHVDLNGVVDAVNEGCIFRLLMKPCGQSVLTEAITAALACYHERKEERVRIELPVHLCRSASGLKVQSAHTVDISNSGARLAGLEEPLELGEVLKVECGNRRAPFRVVWTGAQCTATEGQAGLECLAVDADIWKLNLCQLEGGEPLMRARAVQSALLPQEKPPLKTLDYAGNCIQARTVGGDYYDFLDMGPGEVGFVLADVAGKGIAAALLMANLQGSLHSQYGTGSKDIPQLLASVNRHFYKHTAEDRYATFFWGGIPTPRERCITSIAGITLPCCSAREVRLKDLTRPPRSLACSRIGSVPSPKLSWKLGTCWVSIPMGSRRQLAMGRRIRRSASLGNATQEPGP